MNTLSAYNTNLVLKLISHLSVSESVTIQPKGLPPILFRRMGEIRMPRWSGKMYVLSNSYEQGKKKVFGPELHLYVTDDKKKKVIPVHFKNETINLTTRSFITVGGNLVIEDNKLLQQLILVAGVLLNDLKQKGYFKAL
jgi:hypothetical protein